MAVLYVLTPSRYMQEVLHNELEAVSARDLVSRRNGRVHAARYRRGVYS